MNILLLMSDDHRADAISCLGDPNVQTPFLDGLAQDGCHLLGARIMGGHSEAVCVPSRAGLYTGRHCFAASQGLQSYTDQQAIPEKNILLGEHLRAHGWTCFHTGKWHLDSVSFNRCFDRGQAVFFGGMSDHFSLPLHDRTESATYPTEQAYHDSQHSTEIFVDAACRFLEERRPDDPPFFLSCCFTSPHDPRSAPSEWHDRFPADSMILPENFLPEHPFDNGELHIRDEQLAGFPRTPDEIRRHLADYAAMIAHQDHHMGRLVEHLDALGMAENTLIIYTSDHGLAIGRHGLMGKQNVYEHALRIPLILRGPGIPRNSVRHGICHGFDLFPTLCDLLDQPAPDSVDGVSRRALIAGDEEAGSAWSYSVYMDAMAGITNGRQKLIRTYRRRDGRGSERLQLFNLVDDPLERQDLADDPAWRKRRQDLESLLLARQRELNDPLSDT
jgi:arylsulfatase A-like enzyme